MKQNKHILFILGLLSGLVFFFTTSNAAVYYVSPEGDNDNSGDHWSQPLQSVQQALDLAQPGDHILLGAGEYWEDLRSIRSGESEAPIHLIGSSGATIKGAGASRVIELNHSYIMLSNLTIDGRIGTGEQSEDYRDKLIYVMGENESGVTGIRLYNLVLKNAGGECLRLKYFAHNNEIGYSYFFNCGVWDFQFNDGDKNGEAIYIGTAPEQLHRNPTSVPDISDSNWVHHNTFDTRGNECVDIKEGASHNLIEHNDCTGQQDSNSAGMNSRGNYNIFRFNYIWGNIGAGIRLGGDTADQGIYNQIYGNTLLDNEYSGLKIMASPQTLLCGNTIRSEHNRIIRGKYAHGIDPRQSC